MRILRPILAEPATVARQMALRRRWVARRLFLAAVLATVGAAGLPAAAGAVLATAPCGSGDLRCAKLAVPLDRSGGVAGTVDLNVVRLPARPVGTQTQDAVVALAGGPGQAAAPLTASFAEALAPLIADRDLIVFDQRGTGASGPLSCPDFSDASVATCAEHLGPTRAFYRSIDSAADIESLREVGGYDKLVLYGVSYGTRVALSYAALYPQHIAALVLDSVVPLEGQDAFQAPSYTALPRVLGDLCAARACKGITASPSADLRKLLARLSRKSIRGRIVDPDGRRGTVKLTRFGVWQIILGGDLNPSLRADLPGAVHAVLDGDPTAILRLRARAAGLSGTAATDDGVNDVLFTTTRCEETAFPWDRSAGARTRTQQAEAAARGLAPAAFAPFDARFALDASIMPLCVGWPNASPAPAPLPALPNVPTLVLTGAADLRTPIEQARRAVAGIPGAQIVSVPATGHSTLGSDLGHCATDALKAFASVTPPPACGAPNTTFSPSPVPPTSLRKVRGTSKARRTLNAVGATIADVKRQIVGDAIASGSAIHNGSRTGGLRGGIATYANGIITFQSVVYVPGVTVSGFYALEPSAGTTRLLVRGSAAARGQVTIDAGGHVAGDLGGQHVTTTTSTAAAARRRIGAATDFAAPAFPYPALRAP